MNFPKILNKVVSKENLSLEEAAMAMENIMSGKLLPTQIAALIVALRVKGETENEISGF